MDDSYEDTPSGWKWGRNVTFQDGTKDPEPIASSSSQPIRAHRASMGPTAVPIPSSHEAVRRRTSVIQRVASLGDAGGANSLNNFAASWHRAAGFYAISPTRSVSSHLSTESDENFERIPDVEQTRFRQESLLRAAIDNERRVSAALPDVDLAAEGVATATFDQPRRKYSDPELPLADASYNSSYGATAGDQSGKFPQHVSKNADRRLSTRRPSQGHETDTEQKPLLKQRSSSSFGSDHSQAEYEGAGRSTLAQTVFNSVNVLVGVGMLALPLGFRYTGWIIGLLFFLFSAISTSYTAKILAKCLSTDPSLVSFSDLAYAAFGSSVQFVVSILFSLELLAACVALIVLFADSINLLIDIGMGLIGWKIVCGLILIPLSFMPMRFLSFTSVLGIGCCVAIIGALFVDGFIKPHGSGSLLDPMPTRLFPEHWATLPLAFGILMSPWGGHSVFPNIYRDMRHPGRYNRAVNITYIFTYLLEVALAIAGYLMYGEGTQDEITKNIFLTEGYPQWLSILIMVSITIVPLTKIPLIERPIISILEVFFGVADHSRPGSGVMANSKMWKQRIIRIAIRCLLPVVLVILAILFPEFDRLMAIMGAFLGFSICIILPCAFHLKMFGKDLGFKRRALDWSLLSVCAVFGVAGTICSAMPKEMLGAE